MMTPAPPSPSSFIPDPWNWASFVAAIEQARGRPLLLAPAGLSSDLSSLWIATADADLIVYPRNADRTRQLREIAHQAAHMLFGHQPATNVADIVFRSLDPALVGAVLTVSRYSQADERAAAEFAAQVVAHALAAGLREERPQ